MLYLPGLTKRLLTEVKVNVPQLSVKQGNDISFTFGLCASRTHRIEREQKQGGHHVMIHKVILRA